jgi:hypothetical protein
LELVAVGVNGIQEKKVQQPEMMLIASIKKVKTLKSPEERSPCSRELASYLHP